MGILGSDLNSKQDFTEIKSINEVADIFLSFMLQSTLQGYSLFYDDEDVDKKKKNCIFRCTSNGTEWSFDHVIKISSF